MNHLLYLNCLFKVRATSANGSCVNSSVYGQDGHHFSDGIFKCIFLIEKFGIVIQISLRFVPKGSINSKSALVQVMACRLFGDKPLPEQMLT